MCRACRVEWSDDVIRERRALPVMLPGVRRTSVACLVCRALVECAAHGQVTWQLV